MGNDPVRDDVSGAFVVEDVDHHTPADPAEPPFAQWCDDRGLTRDENVLERALGRANRQVAAHPPHLDDFALDRVGRRNDVGPRDLQRSRAACPCEGPERDAQRQRRYGEHMR